MDDVKYSQYRAHESSAEYDLNVHGTNHHPINWLSCIINGPVKTSFHRYLTNDKAGNQEFFYLMGTVC